MSGHGFSKGRVMVPVMEKYCGTCVFYKEHDATREEPGEAVCTEYDFGEADICDGIHCELNAQLYDHKLNNTFGYIETSAECRRIAEEEGVDYGVDWKEHEYWYIAYDGSAPIGFNTIKAIWEEMFV